MKIAFISFLSSLVSILIIDSVWLGVLAKDFYKHHLGYIMSESPKLALAGIFYFIYSIGITFFIVLPAIQGNFSILKTFLHGAFLGFIAYSAYDLVNHATIKNWPSVVTLVDLAWGTLLTGTISVIAFLVTRHL